MTVTAFLHTGDRTHGLECPYGRGDVDSVGRHHTFACECVACYCVEHLPGGGAGACRRCHRPLVVDGKVVRLTREQVTA